jgi:hypothetical protein
MSKSTEILLCEQLDDLQALSVATNINRGAAKHYMLYIPVLTVAPSINHKAANNKKFYKCSLSARASIMELRRTGCFTSARCRTKHQYWSCEKPDDLQMLSVAPFNWMIYK